MAAMGFPMLDDMALLKRTMQQMDAEDPTVAQAAKDRAAQILSEAKLSFAKMAELIEERRLLLRPAIVARIKRMDQPGSLGDAAFHDTGTALRKEGQSFLQIAEAIEASNRPAPAARFNVPAQESPPLEPMDGELRDPAWLSALLLVVYPVRHPLRFLTIALLVLVLFYGARGVVAVSHQVADYFDRRGAVRHEAEATTPVSPSVNEQAGGTTASPTLPAPFASPTVAATAPSSAPPPATADASPPPTTPAPTPSPSASQSAALAPALPGPAPSSATPTVSPDATPHRDARATPARPAANRAHAFEDAMPNGLRRNSRVAGPCRGGVGGCYWGGVQF